MIEAKRSSRITFVYKRTTKNTLTKLNDFNLNLFILYRKNDFAEAKNLTRYRSENDFVRALK